MIPEPTVTVTRHTVSCLPETRSARIYFELHVVQVPRRDGIMWAVTDIDGERYDSNGVHCAEGYVRHRDTLMDLETALALAKRLAPTLIVNGLTVADVLARGTVE